MISHSQAATLTLVEYRGCRRRLDECASCGQVRVIAHRGLCDPCTNRYERDGTITQWGYVKADRVADYAWLRRSGELLTVAAARVGVSERTAWRYEAQLKDAAEEAA